MSAVSKKVNPGSSVWQMIGRLAPSSNREACAVTQKLMQTKAIRETLSPELLSRT
jgi:hypothetical protein